MKLAANLTLLYGREPEAERFAHAARDGFAGVEILFPYAEPPAWYARQLRVHGLQLVLINTPVAQGAGRLGFAAIPGKQEEFRSAFAQAATVARATGCKTIHVMAGVSPAGVVAAESRAALLENLRWAAEAARDDFVLTLEALNRIDFPGYAYHQPREAIDILRAIDTPRVRLQFDLYHAAKEGLDLPSELAHALPHVRHIQIAGAPERHEPDLANDKLLECFDLLARRRYEGWVGCEYRPRAEAGEHLSWLEPLVQKGWVEPPGQTGP